MGFFKDVGKALLIFINTIFLILGWILIGFGIYLIKTNYFDEIYQEHLTTRVSTFSIVIGCITTIISFFGFWGTSTNKKWMLKIYASTLLVILFIQICVGIFIGILMTVGQDDVKEEKLISDAVHLTYECCGYSTPNSMKNEHGFYPASCCGVIDEEFTCSSPTFNIGCSEQISKSVVKVAVIYAAFIGFQILCSAIAFFVAFSATKRRTGDNDSASSYYRMSL